MTMVVQVENELARSVLENLVMLSEKSRGKRFQVDGYTVFPKTLYICESGMCYFLEVFSKDLENVKGIVVDVAGVHPKYMTQLEIYDDGRIVVSPSGDRSVFDVKRFLNVVFAIVND